MSMTVELPDALASDVRRKARAHGKDPAQFVIEQLEKAPDVPAHIDGSRYKTVAQWTQDVRERHGFPSDWGTKAVELSPEDWAAIEAASLDLFPVPAERGTETGGDS